jgi:hypothetical protein
LEPHFNAHSAQTQFITILGLGLLGGAATLWRNFASFYTALDVRATMLPARTNTIKKAEKWRSTWTIVKRPTILALVIGGQCGPSLRASITPEARLGPSNDLMSPTC